MTVEGQYYLPPLDDCTTDFLKDAFLGKKKVSLTLHTLTIVVIQE
jgi:hypothetical protein